MVADPDPAPDLTPDLATASGDPGPGDLDPDATAPLRIRRPLALSPSRAADFKTCPLLYRLRAIDHLPEPPSPEAARGSLVHAVLEEMFAQPAEGRTLDSAIAAVDPVWVRMSTDREDLAGVVDADALDGWLESARELVRGYFALEDPTAVTVDGTELLLEVDAGAGPPLRGYLDRLDVVGPGEIRVVDYKTGRSPDEQFEQSALFQMKFYALMLLRSRGVLPRELTLLYLGDREFLSYRPTEPELAAFERTLGALWEAMMSARRTGDFPPRTSSRCNWCAYRSQCPEFGGNPPPYPFPDAAGAADLITDPVGIPAVPSDPPTVPIRIAG